MRALTAKREYKPSLFSSLFTLSENLSAVYFAKEFKALFDN